MKPVLFAFLLAAYATAQPIDLMIEPGERWWAGVIADAHLMPFTAESTYRFHFNGDTGGNQGQPLLVSDKGRYIWCDEPFAFTIANGRINADCAMGKRTAGKYGSTLREVYEHVGGAYFPPSGKTPDERLFLHPQYNTWIELTYNQNQADVLKYARAIPANGFPAGVLMIDEGWFSHYGNLDFDRARFPDPRGMIAELHRLGSPVMLWVCPYISPDGQFFTELRLAHNEKKQTVWFVDAENPRRPALMEWWDGFSAIVDLTNPQAKPGSKGSSIS